MQLVYRAVLQRGVRNIVAIYSTTVKVKIPLHISPDVAQ